MTSPGPGPHIIKGDAFRLPFPDETFDIVVADPPYDIPGAKAGRHKAGVSVKPYIGFSGRGWWWEAWRVLKPTGRFYVFAAIRELRDWLRDPWPQEEDILSWSAPNVVSINARASKRNGDRVKAWRPIIEWKKPDAPRLQRINTMVYPNYIIRSLVAFPMAERLPWPNQLPVAVVRWLIEPVIGSLVLDLFAGTGSTRMAAEGLGRRAVSIEITDEAIAINEARSRRPLDIALEAAS